MRSPAVGIAWVLWRRHDRVAISFLVYGTSLVLITQLWPPASTAVRMQIFAAALPLFFGLLYVTAAFAYPEADIMAAGSGFPRPMLLLPVRTGELVFWPMLYGTATVALAWIALARLILIPNGMQVPVGWLAAMFAALLACVQALSWSPVGLPYLRPILGLLLFGPLVALGEVAALNGVSPRVLMAAYGSLIGVAYIAAAGGLARARRGDGLEREWLRRRSRSEATPLPPEARRFSSPAQAQLWFEWRRNGITLPLFVGGVCLLLTLPLLWVRDLAPLGTGGLFPLPALRNLDVNLWVKLQQGCLFWPMLLAAIAGCGLRKSETRRKDFSLHPFFATRPLSSGALVRAKLQMAALSTLAAWGVLLFFVGIWLLTPARDEGRTGPLGILLLRHCSARTVALAVLLLIVLIGWTWKNQVQGLFVDLTGRRWIVQGYPTVVFGLLLAAFLAFMHWTGGEREMDLQYYEVPRVAAWLVGLAVTLKALVAGWTLRTLYCHRLSTPRALGGLVATWLVLVLGLFALLSWSVQQGLLAFLPLPAGFLAAPYLAAAAALFVPLDRLALAPLALAWNRHR